MSVHTNVKRRRLVGKFGKDSPCTPAPMTCEVGKGRCEREGGREEGRKGEREGEIFEGGGRQGREEGR